MKNDLMDLKAVKALVLALLFVVVAGCTKEASEEQVSPLMDEYIETYKAKDFEKLLTYYHPEFFNVQSEKAWVEHLQHVRATMGEVASVKLKQKQVNTVFSGRRFIYEYSVKYEKGYAKEVIMFVQKIGTEGIKVQMHKIDSKLLRATR